MSTAGKVLVVLVMLSMLLWVLMASAVTQLNSNWGEAVQKYDTQIAQLQEDFNTAHDELYSLKSALALEQDITERNRSEIRVLLSKTEKRQADINEALERIKVQVDLADKAVTQAIANKEQRTKDVADLEVEKAKLLTEVDVLKDEDSQLRETRETLLTSLRDTLAENKKLIERMTKSAGSVTQ